MNFKEPTNRSHPISASARTMPHVNSHTHTPVFVKGKIVTDDDNDFLNVAENHAREKKSCASTYTGTHDKKKAMELPPDVR